jgi:hypothetical protein
VKIGVYKYNGSVCGASFAIPQIAGLFLLSRQIDKEIRFNEFIEIIKKPQMVNKDGTNYINANELIKQVKKNRMIKMEKTKFFHDQKSDTFFKDKSTGVYTVPPQEKNTKELGKETFNEQKDTEEKIEVEQKIAQEIRELESEQEITGKGN